VREEAEAKQAAEIAAALADTNLTVRKINFQHEKLRKSTNHNRRKVLSEIKTWMMAQGYNDPSSAKIKSLLKYGDRRSAINSGMRLLRSFWRSKDTELFKYQLRAEGKTESQIRTELKKRNS